MKWVLAAFLAACTIAGAMAPAEAADAGTLTVAKSDQYGDYIADAKGRPVYMMATDQKGAGNSAADSFCYALCASIWPPVLVTGKPDFSNLPHPELAGTIQRDDGTVQATYAGWPLYHFINDEGNTAINGEKMHSFGSDWFLLAPGGNKIDKGK